MQRINSMTDSEGNSYEIADRDMAAFRKDFPDAVQSTRYSTPDGRKFDIPSTDADAFMQDFPDARPMRRMTFKGADPVDVPAGDEMKFYREYRRDPKYAEDREEAAKSVQDRTGSETWAGIRGAVGGAAEGAVKGGLRAFGKELGAFAGLGTGVMRLAGTLAGARGSKAGSWLIDKANAVDEAFNWFDGDLNGGSETLDAIGERGSGAVAGVMPWLVGGAANGATKIAAMGTMSAMAGNDAAIQTYDEATANGASNGDAVKYAAASGMANTAGAALMGVMPVSKFLAGFGIAGKVASKIGVKEAATVAPKTFNELVRAQYRGWTRAMAVNQAAGIAESSGIMGVQSAVNNAIGQLAKGNDDIDVGEAVLAGLGGAAEGVAVGAAMGGVHALDRNGIRKMRTDAMRNIRRNTSDNILTLASTEEGREMLRRANPEGVEAIVDAARSGRAPTRQEASEAWLPQMSQEERLRIAKDFMEDEVVVKDRTERIKRPAPNFRHPGESSADAEAKAGEYLAKERVEDETARKVAENRSAEGARLDEEARVESRRGDVEAAFADRGAEEYLDKDRVAEETARKVAENRGVEGERMDNAAREEARMGEAEEAFAEQKPQETQSEDHISKYVSGKKPLEASRIRRTLEKKIDFGGETGVTTEADLVDKAVGGESAVTAEIVTSRGGKPKMIYTLDGNTITNTAAEYARARGVKVDENSVSRADEYMKLHSAVKEWRDSLDSKGFRGGDIESFSSDDAISKLLGERRFTNPLMPEDKALSDALKAVKEAREKRGDWSVKEAPAETPKNKGKVVPEVTPSRVKSRPKELSEMYGNTNSSTLDVIKVRSEKGILPDEIVVKPEGHGVKQEGRESSKSPCVLFRYKSEGAESLGHPLYGNVDSIVKWAKEQGMNVSYEPPKVEAEPPKVKVGKKQPKRNAESRTFSKLKEANPEVQDERIRAASEWYDNAERKMLDAMPKNSAMSTTARDVYDEFVNRFDGNLEAIEKRMRELGLVKEKKGQPTKEPVVKTEQDGDGTVLAPKSVEDSIASMPYGRERSKAQYEYLSKEIDKAEEAIKGQFKENSKGEQKRHGKWSRVPSGVDENGKDTFDEIPNSVTIKVPGDGEFTVPNNPDGIERLRKVADVLKGQGGESKPMYPKFRYVQGSTDTSPQPTGFNWVNEKGLVGSTPMPPHAPAKDPKAMSTVASAKKTVADFVSKDKMREGLQKPIVEDGRVSATDGHALVMLDMPSAKGEKSSLKLDEVMKSCEDGKVGSAKIDVADAYQKVVQGELAAEEIRKINENDNPRVEVGVGKDGKLSIHATNTDASGRNGEIEYMSRNADGAEHVSSFVPSNLRKVLDVASKIGAKDIEMSWNNRGILVFKADGMKAAVLPLIAGDGRRPTFREVLEKKSAKKPSEMRSVDIGPDVGEAEMPHELHKTAEELQSAIQQRSMDPRRISDPEFQAWAKKKGYSPSPNIRRKYDLAMAIESARRLRNLIPNMKVSVVEKPTDPKSWEKAHPLVGKSGNTLGWFSPTRNEVVLLPGADSATAYHEIGWHAVYDWAKTNNPTMYAKMRQWALNIDPKLQRRIVNAYSRIPGYTWEMMVDEFGAFRSMDIAGKMMERGAFDSDNAGLVRRTLESAKDVMKDWLAKHGGNRIDLKAFDTMSPDDAMDVFMKAATDGGTLGDRNMSKLRIDVDDKGGAYHAWRRNLLDSTDALRQARTALEKVGIKLDESTDFYSAKRAQPGMEAAWLNKVDQYRRQYERILRDGGISHENVQEYMFLRAVADRNAKIANRNGNVDGSGESANNAQRILDRYYLNTPEAAAYDRAASLLYTMQMEGLDRRVSSGLVKASDAMQWMAEEPFHVPMKSSLDENGNFAGWSASKNLEKVDFRMAEGRTTLPGDVVSWMFDEFANAGLRSAENDTRRVLAKAIALYGKATGLGRISREGKEVRVRGEQGNLGDLVYRSNGREMKINLAGDLGGLMAAAVNGRDLRQAPGWVRKATRIWASTATEWSPAFALRNLAADTVDITQNLVGDFGVVKGMKMAAKMQKFHKEHMSDIAHYISTGEARGWLKRYVDAGGMMSGVGKQGYADITEEFSKLTNNIGKGESTTKKILMFVPRGVQALNKWAELTNRLGAFRACAEEGMTDRQAAMWSRESSVDFNMRGNLTGITNSLWMFSNATIGGSTRLVRAMRLWEGDINPFSKDAHVRKGGAALVGGMFAYGLMEGALECWMNMDDAERERNGEAGARDIPEFQRANSLYVRNGGKLVRVPFHAGPLSLIKYAGNLVARIAWEQANGGVKQITKEEAIRELGKEGFSVAMHFTGTGDKNLASLATSLSPSVIQPVAQIGANQNVFGQPLAKVSYSKNDVRSEMGRDATPEIYKVAAKAMNEMTGGSKYRAGWGDVPPEYIQAIAEGAGKNALRDIVGVASTGLALFGIRERTEEEAQSNTPIKRDYVRDYSSNSRRFYDAKERYQADSDELQKMKKDKLPHEEIAQYIKEHPWLRRNGAPQTAFTRLETKIKNLREKENATEDEERKKELRQRRQVLQNRAAELLDRRP